MMDYTIRPATPADAPGIAKVACITWNITYTHSIAAHNSRQFLNRAYALEILREEIEDEHTWFYVAAQGRGVVGFAQYIRRFDAEGELVRLYVHPDHQRNGIGRAFLATGLAALATSGIGQCYVSVEVDNIDARTFYERFGFRPYREYGHFLGNQITRLVEYKAPITQLLDVLDLREGEVE